jgi:hypothetical protein
MGRTGRGRRGSRAFANGGALTADDLITILAPLGTAAGVRPLVSPTSKSAVAELVQDTA